MKKQLTEHESNFIEANIAEINLVIEKARTLLTSKNISTQEKKFIKRHLRKLESLKGEIYNVVDYRKANDGITR